MMAVRRPVPFLSGTDRGRVPKCPNKKGRLKSSFSCYEISGLELFLETADERHFGAAVGAGALGDDAVVLGNAFLRVDHFLLAFALHAITNYCHKKPLSMDWCLELRHVQYALPIVAF